MKYIGPLVNGFKPICEEFGKFGCSCTAALIKFLFSEAPSQIEATILKPKRCNKVTPSQNAVLT